MDVKEQFDPFRSLDLENEPPRGVARQSKPALMCSIRRKNGTLFAFSYSLLQRIECDPASEIALHFPDYSLSLRGQQLEEIYDQILRHVRTEICELDDLHAGAIGAKGLITEVVVTQMPI